VPGSDRSSTRDFELSAAGARWDDKAGSGTLDESRPKELYALMPVIMIKAVMVDKAEVRDAYICPVYKTTSRGLTYARLACNDFSVQRAATQHATPPETRQIRRTLDTSCSARLPMRHAYALNVARALACARNAHAPDRTRWVFNGQLRTKYDQAKWILAGVALIMDVVFV
jgi:hypothetical protein